MKDKYFCRNVDTDECELLIRLGTKNRDKGLEKGEQIINDLLSSITFTMKNYKGSPEFIKSLGSIKKRLWRML